MYKQRKHVKIGIGNRTVDKYEEIDCFIPEAIRVADEANPNRAVPTYNRDWSTCYCSTMDKMLQTAGLRIL